MASNKRIKGITIEIGGETKGLDQALQKVNQTINKTNTELKDLDKALKLDPKNTELLAQKQEVLSKNIDATKERLKMLTEAQKQLGSYNNLTEEQKEKYRALEVEITHAKDSLNKMNEELKNTSKIDLSKIQNGLKKVGEVALEVSKKLLQVSTAIGGALSSVVGLGVKSYASLEQNIGGIEKLFGDSAEKLIENSKKAYKTAGLSANQYMETATSFSASLLKGLGNDTEKATQLTDRAIRDMSDNANTFGSSMEEVMNVYKALSKEQFSTLDNLRLGYSGTKKGMEQLIKDASTYTDIQEELGITVDASSMSFDNMINAISVIQSKMGIAGTTTKEAEGTISGSLNMMKASFDNFLNGSGSPEALSESIMSFLKNIAGAIKKLAPSILKGLVGLIKDLVPQVIKLIMDLLPELASALTDLIDSLLDMVTNNQDKLQETITNIINTIVLFFTENLPKVLEIAIQLVVTLAKGIAEAVPTLVPAIVECLVTMVNTLVENLPLLIDTAIELIMALAEALLDNLDIILMAIVDAIVGIIECLDEELPKIEDKIPELIEKIVQTLIKLIPKLLEALIKIIEALLKFIVNSYSRWIEKGKEILGKLGEGLKEAIPKVIEKIKELIGKIAEKIGELPGKAVQWGKDMIQGLIDGIKGMIGKVGEAAGKVAEKIKNFLHFSRPDTGPLREYEEWMPDFVEGLATSLRKSSGLLESATLDMANGMANSVMTNTSNALRGLRSGIDASLNPTINPNISYDLNYKLMASAMKEALKEVQVELDDRELGRFVDKQVSEEVYS